MLRHIKNVSLLHSNLIYIYIYIYIIHLNINLQDYVIYLNIE